MRSLGCSEDSLEAQDNGLAGARNFTLIKGNLEASRNHTPSIVHYLLQIGKSSSSNRVFAQMYLIITRLVQCFNKYCLHGKHFTFTLEKSWCHPLHRNKADSTYKIALAMSWGAHSWWEINNITMELSLEMIFFFAHCQTFWTWETAYRRSS